MRRAALLVLTATVVFAACSSKTPKPGASGSSTPSVKVSASASPTKKPAHVVSARQALYVYQNAIWLYDVKTNKTRQVTQGGTVSMPKWLDTNHFSFVQGGNTLKIADLKAASTTDVFTAPGGIQAYGWSPDGQTVAYIEMDSTSYPHLRYRSLADGATQSVATLAPAPGRDGSQFDDVRIQYGNGGASILVIFTPSRADSSTPPDQSQFQVRGVDGSLSFSLAAAGRPTMGLFSRDGKTVYYMDFGRVRAWIAGTGSTRTLRKISWFDPSTSPDGLQIAFDTGADSPDTVRVRILDLRALTVTTISKPGRYLPIFAGPHTVWAQEIKGCRGCGPVDAIAHVYSIDTKTRAERLLAIPWILDADVLYG